MFVSKVTSWTTTCDRFPYMARKFLFFADNVSRLVLSLTGTRILSVQGYYAPSGHVDKKNVNVYIYTVCYA